MTLKLKNAEKVVVDEYAYIIRSKGKVRAWDVGSRETISA